MFSSSIRWTSSVDGCPRWRGDRPLLGETACDAIGSVCRCCLLLLSTTFSLGQISNSNWTVLEQMTTLNYLDISAMTHRTNAGITTVSSSLYGTALASRHRQNPDASLRLASQLLAPVTGGGHGSGEMFNELLHRVAGPGAAVLV